ncbi:baseplate J/gp47 family protein [Pandoraea oxalativorans]|uniref:Uncharacterized protein n=1 Tax=Pandoraea oxalativorans TaxID=573737 RepID=A0A0E3U7F4_9BURK|nr:baseplate J/gp47 family protein [Pandoraea oxalativorans]AKC70819.1 hypothetical protein MB84_17040 [Pandoraea oxalativorans]
MHNLIIRDGTSQAMRALPPLQDGYFHLDEMTFHELLDVVVEFAALVRFHNAEDKPDGDWSPFFRADETVVMSRILAFDLSRETERFAQWWRDTPEYDGVRGNGAGIRAMIGASPVPELVATLNGWYVALSQAQTDNGLALRTVLRAVIMQLSRRASGVPDVIESMSLREPLDPVWSEAERSPHAPAGTTAAPEPDTVPGKADVRADFHAYMKAIEMVRNEALARLPASLQSGHHDPAVGLLIAFVKQFEKLQNKLNGYTQKFIDFYYERMLGSTPRGVVPDRTWLVLRRNPDARDVTVPAGTAFPAGIDAHGQDIVYESEDELRVSGARVSRVQTLYLDHNGYSMPENLLAEDPDNGATGRKWPTAAWFEDVPCGPPGVEHPHAWPVLGAPKPGAGNSPHSAARVGFALASKVLLLKEGERVIRLTITFADERLVTQLGHIADAVFNTPVEGARLNVDGSDQGREAANDNHLRRQDLYLKILRSLFSVSLTGEKGWIDIAGYVPGLLGNQMTLSFVLAPEAPSVVRYSPVLHGENFDVDTPLVRCVINPGAYLFPYGLLRNLPVTGAQIDVDAHGCRDLVLYNNIGQLSAATPFAPFGPLPRLGSYLVAGSTEMASKRITRFGLRIEWADLPRATGGFGTWYDGYDVRLTNEDYVASVEVLAKGGWLPAGDAPRPVVPLFHTRVTPSKGERIDNAIVWEAGSLAHLFEPDEGVSPAHPLTWGPGAKNGFFKFTFAAPAFAFGHDAYPQVLSSTMLANSRKRMWRRQRPMPRAPYTPIVNTLSFDYSATGAISVDRIANRDEDGRFLHLFPCGWESLDMTSYPAPELLPRFEDAGNLYIGIDANDLGDTLTLLFQLREDSRPVTGAADDASDNARPTGLRWSYLSNNVWKPLALRDVLTDGTHKLMTSGIVTLRVPDDIGNRNTVMPDGLYWLRVSANRDMEKYCSLYAVHAQALQVRRGSDVPPEVPMVLPAGTIVRSRRPLPGIVSVVQPLPSCGGRAQETREQMRTRVSERLRHKQRAVTPADFESMILEAFAEVYKVKCFANLSTRHGPVDCVRPGQALVVPLPYWPATKDGEQMPMLDGNVVQQIAEFANALSSPWASVSVENPVYERIQVRCKVRFADRAGNGHYLALLDAAISRYLTPWQDDVGYRTHFGWCIRQHDLEAYIGALPYVQYVSGFSMLRIATVVTDADATAAAGTDMQTFTLFDTARRSNGAAAPQTDIVPLYPWSIAIPVAHHAIEAVDDDTDYEGVPTTLSQLEIGTTFIISDDDHERKTDRPA